MNLYAIQTEIATLIEAILDGAGDTVEAQAALDEHLAGLAGVLESKARRCRRRSRRAPEAAPEGSDGGHREGQD
jgi:hypothetical protein